MGLARNLLSARLARPLGRSLQGLGSCLMYHRILPEERIRSQRLPEFAPNLELTVSTDQFDRHLEFISRHFQCVSVPDAISSLEAGTLSPMAVLVTFDDGYRDNLVHALPILRKYRVPATIYLTTEMVDGLRTPWWVELEEILRQADRIRLDEAGSRFNFSLDGVETRMRAFGSLVSLMKGLPLISQDEMMGRLRTQVVSSQDLDDEPCAFLTWDECRGLAAEPLITLGAHTLSHAVLRATDGPGLREELRGSKQLLEARLGRPVEHLAYPFGGREHAGDREFQAAREAGFRSAFTTRPGHLRASHRNRLHSLPRISVSHYDTTDSLAWKLGGFDATLRGLVDSLRKDAGPNSNGVKRSAEIR